MKIPYSWLSYDDTNPAKGRWDQAFIEQILLGSVWLPPGGLEFTEIPWSPQDGVGRVIVMPVGSYFEHNTHLQVAEALSRDLARLEWSVLIATSDECQLFPWPRVRLPESCKLWIQTPQPEKAYPIGARFIPYGPPSPPQPGSWRAASTRVWDIYFQGQVNHERRQEMYDTIHELEHENDAIYLDDTGGFAQGVDRDVYLRRLWNSWVTPAPSGPCTQDSFRLYEALDAGCIPIVDIMRPEMLGLGFWDMVWPERSDMPVETWSWNETMITQCLQRPYFNAARASAAWQQLKRRIATELHDDCGRLSGDTPSDQITAIVPTSPVPSNPDLSMIQTTIASIRHRLPHAEILITCDGVRPEQEHRRPEYEIFRHELAMWCNTEHNVCLWVHDQHLHQSGMLDRILAEVTTPYLLYVEADCPLEGEIDFEQALAEMAEYQINSLRFYHDVAITEGSEHLFVDTDPAHCWQQTIQWSQRPHVARADWYRWVIDTYFGPDSRSFIEDVMHGPAQHTKDGVLQGRLHFQEVWQEWRMALYRPEGNLKRSGHLDGRAGDPKLPIKIAYPGERPQGGMPPGEYAV